MKQYAGSRKVVILNPGKGNIEQAIFILKKELPENNEDYALEEAKKIVEEFAIKRGLQTKKHLKISWIFGALFLSAIFLGYFIASYI